MHAPPENFRYAQKCAALGLHIFPCDANRKSLVKWRAASTTDSEQISKWWRKWPDALPAIDLAKSNHVVIDGDRHGGPDGVAGVEQLFTEHSTSLADVPSVITPGNGVHRWFTQPNGKTIGNSDKAVRDLGINIRGAGGYVIAPGTKLADGRGYSWDKNSPNFFAALRDNAIPTVPSWLVELLARPKQQSVGASAAKPNGKSISSKHPDRHRAYAAAALDRLSAEVASTTEGARNIVLNNAALRLGHMVASGWIDRAVVERRLGAAAIAAGLTATEIRKTLTSGINAGMKEPHPELVDRPRQRNDRQQDAGKAEAEAASVGVSLDDFRAYMPLHNFIFLPSREPWPASSVNSRLSPMPVLDANGKPVLNEKNGKPKFISASAWLDQNKPVEQATWAPGLPMLIEGRLISDGGWFERPKVTCLNLYRPPKTIPGNATEAEPWVLHVRKVFGDDADHIIKWLAHRVQRPADKINHALVLGGKQGIGKDTMLEAVKYAVGPWNFIEVTPQQMLGRFNGFVKSVVLRVSEARDLGEINRYQFYDHLKAYTAAPPDVLRVDEKNLREHSVLNCCGVIITTNHKSDGIYLPPDDRRHFVAWSPLDKEDFVDDYWRSLWGWYANGGYGHVTAYLAELDISDFDPKAPPPKSAAFWSIVDASRAPEDAELADVLDRIGNPNAVTLARVQAAAQGDFAEWMRDRKNCRAIPHRFEQCGYVPVRNDASKQGLWAVSGTRQTVYAKEELPLREQLRAASELARQ